ncbi:MAG: DUF1489 family protein [Alphaproteobacteria bacterium]|nr:MAG: DUF1489 family protein [Alphaproteobacteria bacterium]
MSLHLIRVAAGIQSIEELADLQARRMRAAGSDDVAVLTGIAPRRIEEILDGGSLYWIIKGAVQARQKVVGIDRLDDRPHGKGCRFRLAPEIILTEIRHRRSHQGWRYLKPEDAPPDRDGRLDGADGLPAKLAAELRELALV